MLPPKELIPFADQLAESLCSGNGLAAFRLAVHLHRLSTADSKDAGQHTSAQDDLSSPIRVGIWEKKSGNGNNPFIRIDTADRWRLWADVPEIAPKNQKQRVVLIGESVARGFFYDPYANPAMVLQHMLQAAATTDDIEVIDLARIDLSLASLLKLTQSAIELEPDAIVIFAGNNWHPISGLGPDQLREIAIMIRCSGSWKTVKSYLDQHLRRQVESLLADFEDITKSRGVPIVFLIPEFNLRDWVSDAAAPVLLNDSELRQWFRTRKNAERALDEERFREAAHLARSLVELDGGTTPVGFNIESKCNIEAGQLRVLRENARDAGMALTKHQSPRCFGVVQEVLRKKAHTHGIRIVDLPRRFEEYLGGLPDRRVFHDYCHLTLEGMKVAMASAAEHLLPLLSRPHRSWSSLLDTECAVPDKVVAEANFLAAVHNANLGNSTEMVRYHLDKAIQYYPAVSRMIRLYLDFHLRRTPSPLCSAFEQMARTESPSVLSMLLRCSRHEKTIHFGLVEELIRVLMTIQPEAAEHARKLTIAEHRISPERLSLLQKPYSAMLSELSWDQERYGYYRSCTRESKFVFVCEKPQDTEFRITSRIHVNSGAREIVVRVNKVSVHTFEGKNIWNAVAFTVPRSALKEGINELEIVWPEEGWIFPERTARITAALESARIPEAGPIFGELHTLMVSSMHVQESVSTEGALLVGATA